MHNRISLQCFACHKPLDIESSAFRCYRCVEWFCHGDAEEHFCVEQHFGIEQLNWKEVGKGWFARKDSKTNPPAWKETSKYWLECKRHQEQFASDNICSQCVEDILAGGL